MYIHLNKISLEIKQHLFLLIAIFFPHCVFAQSTSPTVYLTPINEQEVAQHFDLEVSSKSLETLYAKEAWLGEFKNTTIPVLLPVDQFSCSALKQLQLFSLYQFKGASLIDERCKQNVDLLVTANSNHYVAFWSKGNISYSITGTNITFSTSYKNAYLSEYIETTELEVGRSEIGYDGWFNRYGISYLITAACTDFDENCNESHVKEVYDALILTISPLVTSFAHSGRILKADSTSDPKIEFPRNPSGLLAKGIRYQYGKSYTRIDQGGNETPETEYVLKSTGKGVAKEVNHNNEMLFPLKFPEAYLNSQFYNPGGFWGEGFYSAENPQVCDAGNIKYPWTDTFCELRYTFKKNCKEEVRKNKKGKDKKVIVCLTVLPIDIKKPSKQWNPACVNNIAGYEGYGHQGVDIRGGLCDQIGKRTKDWIIAVVDGDLYLENGYVAKLVPNTDIHLSPFRYTYLHMDDIEIRKILKKGGIDCKPETKLKDGKKQVIHKCQGIKKGQRLGTIYSLFKDRSIKNTTAHLHFEIVQRTQNDSKKARLTRVSPYHTLSVAYQKLLNQYEDLDKARIDEPLESHIFYDELDFPGFDDDSTRAAIETRVRVDSIFSNFQFTFNKVSPDSLKACLKDEAKIEGFQRFASNQASYNFETIKDALENLIAVRNEMPKVISKSGTETINKYINLRSQVLTQYNQALVLCYKVDSEGREATPEYPIFINALRANAVLSIKSSIDDESLFGHQNSGLVDILVTIANTLELQPSKPTVQYRSADGNYNTPDQWGSYSRAKIGAITIPLTFNGVKNLSTTTPVDVDKFSLLIAENINYAFGLQDHNVDDRFMSAKDKPYYMQRGEVKNKTFNYKKTVQWQKQLNRLCKQLVKSDGKGGFYIADKDWYSSNIPDTATTLGFDNFPPEVKGGIGDYNCFRAQWQEIYEKYSSDKEPSKPLLIDSKYLLMSDSSSSLGYATPGQISAIQRRICNMKGGDTIVNIDCQK